MTSSIEQESVVAAGLFEHGPTGFGNRRRPKSSTDSFARPCLRLAHGAELYASMTRGGGRIACSRPGDHAAGDHRPRRATEKRPDESSSASPSQRSLSACRFRRHLPGRPFGHQFFDQFRVVAIPQGVTIARAFCLASGLRCVGVCAGRRSPCRSSSRSSGGFEAASRAGLEQMRPLHFPSTVNSSGRRRSLGATQSRSTSSHRRGSALRRW